MATTKTTGNNGGRQVSVEFENTIRTYLDSLAKEDELFARFYAGSGKSITECCAYIVAQAKANGRAGYTDAEVYGWAVHYYEEDDIRFDRPTMPTVIVNHTVELTPEEREKARRDAILNLQREYEEKMRRPASRKMKTETVGQPTLF